ncbi:MAG: cob(I)yrinic acid a,c-diamide adenosyltransferase [Bacillota bacterium]|nr:cob(I)yrinic acid a,c-diamide adenosyltransferase [Bacillota bacterium]
MSAELKMGMELEGEVEVRAEPKREAGSRGRGLVLVYTGNGKGKTTAAFGLALRAVGHGEAVYVVQFMKGPGRTYGETEAAHRFLSEWLTVVQSGRDHFVDRTSPAEEDRELARRGMELARRAMLSGRYQLIILDEVNVAVDFGLLSVKDILDLLDDRPPDADVVLTGRYAPPEVMARADTVSEVREIKHHYRQGVAARAGIEF